MYHYMRRVSIMVEKIQIHVIDRDGRFEANPKIPVNTTMREFIRSMGKKFNLPPEGPISSGKKLGNYRYYQPINKRTGQILRGSGDDPKSGLNQTFAELGIQDGDVIKITEMIVGGGDSGRLQVDFETLMEIERKARDFITLHPRGTPPDFYEVEVRGISGIECIENGIPKIRTAHKFTIDLRGTYPEDKPQIRFLTPIFHPYIYENQTVCVTDGWSSAFPLDELFVEIIDRIQCKSFVFPKNVATPANSKAFNWYTQNADVILKYVESIPFPPDNGSARTDSGIESTEEGSMEIDWGNAASPIQVHAKGMTEDGIQW